MEKNLSERVFLYRAKHDLSMREFAPLVGLTSVTQVWRIEQCKISRRREAMLNLKMDELERKDENAESN